MKKRIMAVPVIIGILLLGFTISSCNMNETGATDDMGTTGGPGTMYEQGWTKEKVQDHIQGWPDVSKESASTMLDKYGVPEEITNHRLAWHDKGNWREIVLYKEEVDHDFPMPHKDVLEQFVNHEIPVDKYDEVAQYDGSVIIERTKGVISARCDKEPMNFLALNLANEVANGKRSVEDARSFYAKTVVAFMQGEKSDYTEKLMFSPNKNAGDSDKPVIDEQVVKELMGKK